MKSDANRGGHVSRTFRFRTSVRRRPVRASVMMIAPSLSPLGVSGIAASRRRMSSALSPRGGDGDTFGRSS